MFHDLSNVRRIAHRNVLDPDGEEPRCQELDPGFAHLDLYFIVLH